MPDISMCLNNECHLAKECYRHEVKPSEWQSYSYFRPDEVGECHNFLPIWKPRGENLQDTQNYREAVKSDEKAQEMMVISSNRMK